MNNKNWINIKNRLPNKDMFVLTCQVNISVSWWGGIQRHRIIEIDYWNNKSKSFCLYEKEWSKGFIKKEKFRSIVTHWMMLPDMPKRGK